MPDVFCTKCGHRNRPGANFCSSCGSSLEAGRDDKTMSHAAIDGEGGIDDDVIDAVDDLAEGAAILLIKRGPGSGSRFLLEEPVVAAGRHPDSHIFLDDVTVSRRHAELSRSGDGYRVRDVGSLNGTYLNRERIEDAALANGDELQIGRFKLVFLAPAGHP